MSQERHYVLKGLRIVLMCFTLIYYTCKFLCFVIDPESELNYSCIYAVFWALEHLAGYKCRTVA